MTGGTLSFEDTSVSVDLKDGEVVIDLILLCKDCGGRLSKGGGSYNPDRVYRDLSLRCKDCGKKGKIREDRTEKIVSIYKKIQLAPPKEVQEMNAVQSSPRTQTIATKVK